MQPEGSGLNGDVIQVMLPVIRFGGGPRRQQLAASSQESLR